tara:strand:- start:212 stop:727 length:516 start_codon:yes stop_codon:yes gene_type:complete
MERRINHKIGSYIRQLKDDFKSKLQELNLEEEQMYGVLNYIYTYDHLTIEKCDLQKRKRVKNVVPFCDRCKAKRANGEQCSRRKKNESEFCGTHIKGIPHGQIKKDNNSVEDNKKKITVWAEEIMGITYYIDQNNNVYSPSDILNNIENPGIIAKWEMEGDQYIIPSLFNK